MTLTVPTIESAPTFDGQAVPDSTDWQALSQTIQATGVFSGCTVSQHTGSDMAVNVAAGLIAVAGVGSSVASAANVAIQAASATDRRDIVIYTPGVGVETSGSGTTNSAACKGVACGTAGWNHSSTGNPPVKPAVPAGSVLLAEVYVASSTTAITTVANIIDKTAIMAPLLLGNFYVPVPTGNSVTDSANIRAALTAAANAGGGQVWLQPGNYAGDTGQFWVPPNVGLHLQQSTTWTINCTGGATVDAITIDKAASIQGEGLGADIAAQVIASSTVNCRSLISNDDHGRKLTDGVTNSTSTVTSATANFSAHDLHRAISGTNIPNNSYIGQVNSSTSIGLSSSSTSNTPVNASGTGSGGTLLVGGQQEYAYISGLAIQLNGGAVFADSVVNFTSCFVNSGIDHLVLVCNGVNTGVPGLKIAGGPVSGFGPFYVSDSWIVNSGGDGLLVTEPNPSTGTSSVWLHRVTVEHPAATFHNIHFQGFGGLNAAYLSAIHTENNNPTASGHVAFIYLDGAQNVTIDNHQILCGSIANKYGIWISNNGNNQQIRVRNVNNPNLVAPTLRDDTGFGLSVGGGVNIFAYNGPGLLGTHDGSLVMRTGDVVYGTQSVTFANIGSTGVWTSAGQVILVGQITGIVTVANPQNSQLGQRLLYIFNQDATGHAVSWGTAFKVQASAVSTTASSWSAVEFIYNGSNWIQIGRSATA